MDKKEQIREQMSMLFEMPIEDIKDELVFNKDIYASSLHFFGLLSGIEGLTGKELEYETVKNCKTVGELLALLD